MDYLDQGVEFVLKSLERMSGGEVFVPKIPSMKVVDVARALAPSADIELIGIRPGEKLHETMVPVDEARNTLEFAEYYLIQPQFSWWNMDLYTGREASNKVATDFHYSSDSNKEWLTSGQLLKMVKELAGEA